MVVTDSNNEASTLVGSAPAPSGPTRLSHTGRTQTPPFCCPVVPLPYVRLKTEKMARDNYTIQSLLTVLTITYNIPAYYRIKSTFLPLTNSYCMR